MSFSRKLTLLTIAAAFVCTTPAAIPADSLEDLSNSACEAYRNQEYEQALDHAAQLLGSDEALATKVGVFKCVTCTHVAMRQTRRAKDSIAGMLELDGSARFSPDYSYPPPVIDLYHLVRDSVFADGNDAPMDINTIAIGDFEDNSIFQGKYKDYDYSLFARALVHTVGADLAEATDLKIVDRQRIKNILNELEISRSGFADPKQAVQAGRLLGAQTFIFGQYM
ncbi:MAG: hypothetical protein HKN21_08265, partial [Candidatus Eisenbacteria bacterium]|nr:hypothetical protein [Candidatus Eisenbacteria bacterium]